MKLFFTFALIALSNSAFASSYNVNCSSADGSVRTAMGHMDNFIQITERDWNTGSDTPIRDESQEIFALTASNTKLIKKEVNHGKCVSGTQGYMHRETSTQEVVITKLDGSSFSRNTLNVAPDLASVKTILVCESVVTNIMPCK